jgi:hypothetical protein
MGGSLTVMLISFPESTHYDFAMQFLQRANTTPLGIKPRSHHLEIEANNPVIGRLLQRISENRPVVFPYLGSASHAWIIMGKTRRQLDHMLAQVSRFVVPTYAEFASSNRLPQLRPFKKDGTRLQQLGATLYPVGYYSWRSPVEHFDIILRHLGTWMSLEEDCPSFQSEHPPTYRSLHDVFDAALAAGNWQEAEQCLQEMQQSHLITADNLAFLQVQLLAQQQRWLDIWRRPDYANLARMRMPRAVRAALLTAFHYSVILPLEQQEQWEEALDAFKQSRSELGLLLTGRFGLTQAPVIQVYAYQATVEKDRDSLAQLSSLSATQAARMCIERLQQIVGATTADISGVVSSGTLSDSPLRQARMALADLDYDSAIRFAEKVAQPAEKAILLMQVAFHSSDIPVAEEALLSYWELPPEEQTRLEEQYNFLRPYLKYLLEITNYGSSASTPPTAAPPPPSIQNWLEWFDLAEADPDNPELMASLDRLAAGTDDRYWDQEKVKILSDKLLSFIVDPRSSSHPYTKIAIQRLVDFFLQDVGFPREEDAYGELYETLYASLLEKQGVNQAVGFALLRLAEAILHHSPMQRDRFCANFIDWCKPPLPALENWALEAFDLLAEYGLAPGLLAAWYRDWVSHLLNFPSSRERANLETWLIFGQWIQPGPDLLTRLQQALTVVTEKDIDNPIADLPDGYRISIFSLRESSTARAKQLLLERNKNLDIRICLEKDLNAQAKALAQNSDLVVIVTTCLSHAITYGIGPYLKKDPVYPQSSGSTSLVRAIEGYITRVNQK